MAGWFVVPGEREAGAVRYQTLQPALVYTRIRHVRVKAKFCCRYAGWMHVRNWYTISLIERVP